MKRCAPNVLATSISTRSHQMAELCAASGKNNFIGVAAECDERIGYWELR